MFEMIKFYIHMQTHSKLTKNLFEGVFVYGKHDKLANFLKENFFENFFGSQKHQKSNLSYFGTHQRVFILDTALYIYNM